ncbi:uncharacterized protein LOC125656489 [Ostrea edulis]|uniref:uncharacterized protein LOC125656489 n=1 Tax=Ostrea edulis TaxID=37623 RepID=UPI0024AEA3A2|nr:uncharacterized protein LOC125656489 [Ostrea edulis]
MGIYSSHIIYLLFIIASPATNGRLYQRQFGLKSFGSLTEDVKILFSDEGNTFADTINKCTKFCSGDRRCIGIELCTIKEDRYRCRACCEWKRIRTKSNLTVDSQQCKYLEMADDRSSNVAVNKPASMISAFNPDYHFASNAVDGITVCPNGLYTIHTDVEFMPWIKIDLQNIADVIRVIVFNRQDNNVGENGTIHTCGFFQGPATSGDRIIVLCASGTTGNDVTLMIQSRQGETDILHVCEVQIFVET